MNIRIKYEIEGTVQGVGFRPAVYRLATASGFGGWVRNQSGRVQLCLEGQKHEIACFIVDLHRKLPEQAAVTRIIPGESEALADDYQFEAFQILTSDASSGQRVVIPADLAMCASCERDLQDPGNRRFRYPFTTCSDCGPRYTVVNGMPYDRERTSLAAFPLCADCRREYEDPADRRFHAESIACPVCGPQLHLLDSSGQRLAEKDAALSHAKLAIASGDIVAIRGIGGFLLACDAFNRDALRKLRERKNRPHKPFAVMARDPETALKFCEFRSEAMRLLLPPRAPIVIMDILRDCNPDLPMDLLNSETATLGVMLPYSPLHQLLFDDFAGGEPGFELLVMTSGNRRGEPICLTDEEALERLGDIAELFLSHNRDIELRNDDSLCVLQGSEPQVWRRARGYAPAAVRLRYPLRRKVLALGAELKNTVALGYDDEVVLSPHIGDLETPEAIDGLSTVVHCLPDFLGCEPEIIAIDRHPDMHSTRLGRKLADSGLPLCEVQHHHAHAVAALAEHGLEEAVALVLDGTGLGDDNTIWGAECMIVNFANYERIASFAAVPLPGGDAAVWHPRRQFAARRIVAGADFDDLSGIIGEDEFEIIVKQLEKGINAPLTHAAGRLFDALAAGLEIVPEIITYEGQGPIRLEALAARAGAGISLPDIPFAVDDKDGLLLVDWTSFFADFAKFATVDSATLALAFHHAVADAAVQMIEAALAKTSTRNIVLTGGVFMNRILSAELKSRLSEKGFHVYLHGIVPPNDACVALGQAVVAGNS